MNTTEDSSKFAPTRWTLVQRAHGATPEARAALSELCEAYYQPVITFLLREGRDKEAARETAHEFFARILQRGSLGAADPTRGRFRTYLLGALKHFLADQRKGERRQKRGGGATVESIDASTEMEGEEVPREFEDAQATVSDAAFDRGWALTVMDRALKVVADEFAATGRREQFDQLKPWLAGDAPALSQSQVAQTLGLNPGAVKVAIHRLRKRFQEAVRSEIIQTLPEGANVEEELRYLVKALTHRQ